MSSSICRWITIESFASFDEYDQIRASIEEQVRQGLVTEERVKKPYSGIEWDEHWYRCLADKQTWRLVAPDPPFKGLFKPV